MKTSKTKNNSLELGKILRVPGEKICSVSEGEPGEGTFQRDGAIYASLTGVQSIVEQKESTDGETLPPLIQVIPSKKTIRTLVPEIGQVVVCRITSTNSRLCKCDIIGIEGSFLPKSPALSGSPYHGFIKKEDIRATNKDRVEVSKCYKPGDIVLAKVLSLGDSYSYALTTAENELGVVYTISDKVLTGSSDCARAPMLPLSYCEMICPESFEREPRKVARVQTRYLENYKPPPVES
ncbi:exosome complex component CSL4-like [Symsagittifera roscoffensis]|uniref:exosome complex component CSL4-like n=1 Tax=Symsagittifera roscoffensis TaxID=84072 RepID=UPI00307B3343